MDHFEEEQGDQANDEGPDAWTQLRTGQEGQSALLAKPFASFL